MNLFSVLGFRHLICCYPMSCIFYIYFSFSDMFVTGALFSGCVTVGLEIPGIRLFLPAEEADTCVSYIRWHTGAAQRAFSLTTPFYRVAFCVMWGSMLASWCVSPGCDSHAPMPRSSPCLWWSLLQCPWPFLPPEHTRSGQGVLSTSCMCGDTLWGGWGTHSEVGGLPFALLGFA